MMKLSILTISFAIGTYCECSELAKLPAADKEYLVELERRETQEIRCLNRLDEILTSKWSAEEKKIPTYDLGRIQIGYLPEANDDLSSKRLYHSTQEEWLMDNGSPSKKIETCFRLMVKELEPLIAESDLKCIGDLFESHKVEEQNIETEFIDSLNNASLEDLPFREFFSFHEFVKTTSSDRGIDGLSNREKNVYDQMANYLSTPEDKDLKIFIVQPECDWKNFVALHDAPNPEAVLKEFESQVRRLADLLLGSMMVPSEWAGPLNLKLIIQQQEKWLKSRQEMEKRLIEEVEKLRTERPQRDVKWLCEYARNLAYQISEKQSSILRVKKNTEFSSKIWEIAKRTRSAKLHLEKLHDIRYLSMNELSRRVESDSRCFEGFAQMVKNHQRKAIISAFVDSRYLIQELSCGFRWTFRGIIDLRICHCIGSFCVNHSRLSGLGSNDYEMVRGSDGVYKIIPSAD